MGHISAVSIMEDNNKTEDQIIPLAQDNALAANKPDNELDWANGLRQIYDSVLEEPLPDCFTDLLAKLDDDPV